MRILVIEDDPTVGQYVKRGLEEHRWAVDLMTDGEEGERRASSEAYDLIVLDMRLPGKSGLDVLQSLRAKGFERPVLVLTAQDAVDAKVTMLRAGADDYVTKPFHFEEVLARVQALLRRAGGWATAELRCGPIVLDTRAQSVQVRGQPVELTTFEYRILEHLMLRAGDVISKSELTERLYDQDFERDSNVIEVLVGRLRRKLDPTDELAPIETLRGRGYRFALARDAGG
jgi:DNA-binding response OmpR family regulator